MNKLVTLGTLSLLLVGGALAGQRPVVKLAPAKIKCAVMPMSDVNIKEATKKKMFADYKGNRYFFCCDGCPGAFKANPAKYAKGAHIKTPKVK